MSTVVKVAAPASTLATILCNIPTIIKTAKEIKNGIETYKEMYDAVKSQSQE
jgi:hypothetical protein